MIFTNLFSSQQNMTKSLAYNFLHALSMAGRKMAPFAIVH